MDKYIGFYVSRPIWAGDRLELEDISPNEFYKEMAYIEYSYPCQNFCLKICKDGMMMLQVNKLEEEQSATPKREMCEWWNDYLIFVNCINLLLDSAVDAELGYIYLNLDEVTNRDIFRITVENNARCCLNSQIEGTGSLQILIPQLPFLMLSCFEMSSDKIDKDLVNDIIWKSTLDISKNFFEFRLPIPERIFSSIAKSLSSIMERDYLAPLVSSIAKSISEFKAGNYPISITISWFVIESCLNRKWEKYLQDKNRGNEPNEMRINKDREHILMGRDYPISIISNILELSDLIPYKQFKIINKIRKYRNRVVHQDESNKCKATHSMEAIDLAIELIRDESSIKISTPCSYIFPSP
jgi:hypothetical protein